MAYNWELRRWFWYSKFGAQAWENQLSKNLHEGLVFAGSSDKSLANAYIWFLKQLRCNDHLDEEKLAFTLLKQIETEPFRDVKLQLKHENVSRPRQAERLCKISASLVQMVRAGISY